MKDDEQRQNPMSFMVEMMGKIMDNGSEGEGRAKAWMDRAQEAAGQAQKAQSAMMENMMGMMGGADGGAWNRSTGSTSSGTSATEEDMPHMFGRMTAPWMSFLQQDRKSRLDLLVQHQSAVLSYLDMLDSAIETLRTDLDSQDSDDA